MSFVVALPAFAGTSAKQVIAPPSNPCLMSWFAGASVGYLTELEEPMYNLHVGVTNSCWMLGGWNVGLFAEVGYTQKDESYTGRPDFQNGPGPTSSSFDVDAMGKALQWAADEYTPSITSIATASYDLDIIPITLNVKFERALSGNLNAYIGGGIGAALVDLDISTNTQFGSASDSDWVFVGQVFGGLSYNVTPAFEVYGGVRWIYMSDADLSGFNNSATLELGSDCLIELGARYKF
jgi:opacity protein-like surface antigen